MHEFYIVLLALFTLIGGLIPLFIKKFQQDYLTLLLTFSGSFLLGITVIHLLPEVFIELGMKAGVFILIGFFLQILLQKFSHGAEHGHIHTHHAQTHSVVLLPLLFGLGIHALMEGIPLGFTYRSPHTLPSLFLAVGAHKLPEAITLSTILLLSGKKNPLLLILIFAILSPLAAILAMFFGQKFHAVSQQIIYIIPIVAGAFLHISTTILYESGTKHHELSRQKVFFILIGLSFALATSLLQHTH